MTYTHRELHTDMSTLTETNKTFLCMVRGGGKLKSNTPDNDFLQRLRSTSSPLVLHLPTFKNQLWGSTHYFLMNSYDFRFLLILLENILCSLVNCLSLRVYHLWSVQYTGAIFPTDWGLTRCRHWKHLFLMVHISLTFYCTAIRVWWRNPTISILLDKRRPITDDVFGMLARLRKGTFRFAPPAIWTLFKGLFRWAWASSCRKFPCLLRHFVVSICMDFCAK